MKRIGGPLVAVLGAALVTAVAGWLFVRGDPAPTPARVVTVASEPAQVVSLTPPRRLAVPALPTRAEPEPEPAPAASVTPPARSQTPVAPPPPPAPPPGPELEPPVVAPAQGGGVAPP